ncbi:hypothetical protein B5E84_10125 [Lachnoclostridium sp. An14]|uniref:hypothetical protein n=1 Tax=Lachnoclostridium sp. An14 TaxID=1965562 RepID=UPI000B3AFCA1|nr:hypothetical protein [Lachnoclostridium sp. An14]OUQ17390.1 hypothetical protein B5E84_10125 [Lachnoclostridium sp. An14]
MKKVLIAIGCAALLSGCTQSNIVKPENGSVVPETGVIEGIQIDWAQVQEELDDQFVGSEDYPYGVNIDFYVEDENAYVMTTVEDGVSKEEAARYASAVIRGINDSVAMQDFSYKNDGSSFYGKFSDENVVWIYVMPESTVDDESTWLVDDAIIPGRQRLVEPNYTSAEWETASWDDGTADFAAGLSMDDMTEDSADAAAE